MSHNKDETGRRIVSDAVVVDQEVKFIVYYYDIKFKEICGFYTENLKI